MEKTTRLGHENPDQLAAEGTKGFDPSASRREDDLRVERNRARGPTFSMVVPPDVFELASDLWEPPEPEEHEGIIVRTIRS